MTSGILTSKSQYRIREREMGYFKEIISEAGMIIEYDNDSPNVITQEQSLVVRDMNKSLRSHMLFPSNTRDFIVGLKVLVRNEGDFNKALLPSNLKKDVGGSAVQQDSLIRILLDVPSLQNDVIELLLDRVVECAPKVTNDTSSLRLILNSLRYLSYIDDAKQLAVRLLDILEIASFTAQLDILNLIPEVIPDNEYQDTAITLSKLLNENMELTGAIIDCLNALNLNSELFEEIQQTILAKFDLSSSAKMFPIVFEFLITHCSSKNLPQILNHARNALDTIMGQECDKEGESNKVLIFTGLQTLAIGKRNVTDAWISVVSSIRSDMDHKPINLLLLFMLHSVRKTMVEVLIRKKVKSGLVKIAHLEALFKNYFVPQILSDYLKSILGISSSMLRFYKEPILLEFSSVLYKLLFGHRLIERLQRQEIIYDLIMLSNVSDKKAVTPVLKVFVSLLEDFEKLQQHSVQLMGLLEKLNSVDLKDVKLIFELLCNLTCGERADESMSGLKDEMHMIIRKQLSSVKRIVKHRGIIAAVVMVKNIASTSEEHSEVTLDESSITTDDLPRGAAQDAASLLILTNTCTLGCPDSLGLYYDELSSLLATSNNLNPYFLAWLNTSITNDFENIFVTQTVGSAINNIEMSMQYSLNAEEEVNSPIAINIAELSLKSQHFDNSSVRTLAPLFRLLRQICLKQNDKDLSSIDALLGCAVIMPNMEDMEQYDTDQLRQIVDCVFHCINWFREAISAFVTQTSRKLRTKVLDRLAGLIILEDQLKKCLSDLPDHKLPSSYFDELSQSSKQLQSAKTKVIRPRKKQKIAEMIDDTIVSTSAAASQPAKTITSKKKLKEFKIEEELKFREMDTDIILLLRYPSQIDESETVSQLTKLEINQLRFLIEDLVGKLDKLSNGTNVGISPISSVNLADLITDCVRMMGRMQKHLNSVKFGLDQLDSEENLYRPDINNLKITFGLILKSYVLIFSWSGFQQTKHLILLKDCLRGVRGAEESVSQITSTKMLIMDFIEKLSLYVKYCLYLPAAVHLIQLIQALHMINLNPEIKKKLNGLSEKFLAKRWYNLKGDLESGKNASVNIDILIKAYLSGASVKVVYGIVGTLQQEIGNLKSKEDYLPMLESINKENFYLFYRSLCVALLEGVKKEISSLTNNQHLVLWRTTVLTMQGLMTVVKVHETKTNLISFLKNSVGILKVFLSSGIPILEIMLRSKPDEVVEIFKIMQTSTRFLHHLCCYSKFTKDTGLVAFVPQFRLTLESLLYRVKAALVANGCTNAFWMGTLRNKNLHGEDFLSQSSIATDESIDNDELPPDESEEEVGVSGNEDEQGGDESEGNSSGTEIC